MSTSAASKHAKPIDPPVENEAPVVETRSDKREERQTAVTEFVRDHPLLVIAGGVTAGLVIGALLPRRTGKAIVRRTSALSELAAAAALSFGKDAADRAGDASDTIRKGSHVLADRAEDWTAIALKGASVFAQSAADNIGKLSAAAADKAEDLGDSAADQFAKTRRQAAKRIDKTVPVAEAAAAHAGRRVADAINQLRARLVG